MKTVWTRENLHPLVYRATINGAICTARVGENAEGVAIIDRDQPPLDVTKHDTVWLARKHCEANA